MLKTWVAAAIAFMTAALSVPAQAAPAYYNYTLSGTAIQAGGSNVGIAILSGTVLYDPAIPGPLTYASAINQVATATSVYLRLNNMQLESNGTSPAFFYTSPGVYPIKVGTPTLAFAGAQIGVTAKGDPIGFDGYYSGTFSFQNAGLFYTVENARVLVAAVPEPVTWAMMLTGIGMLGASLRLSRRRRPALAAA